jgi:hypothetical protein
VEHVIVIGDPRRPEKVTRFTRALRFDAAADKDFCSATCALAGHTRQRCRAS